jgi:hypothetical protein
LTGYKWRRHGRHLSPTAPPKHTRDAAFVGGAAHRGPVLGVRES